MTLRLSALPRRIAVLARHYRGRQERRRIQTTFLDWRTSQADLAPARSRAAELLLIRLDDIGDYLLFRNQLQAYKQSARWSTHRIVLLGNRAWQPLFTAFDATAVDEVQWVDKGEYLRSAPYRREVWETLRARGTDTVIAASRTRPLLLDDLCMLAAAPRYSIGAVNTYPHASWNRLSDALYSELFTTVKPRAHEFVFNGDFAEWSCGARAVERRPTLELTDSRPPEEHYLLCFLGANTRSKRWPAQRWIELIEAYKSGRPKRVVLAGNSDAELRAAATIQAATAAESIVGHVSLNEFVAWVSGALAVVSNDTMAAHLGASLGRPTVIVANGVNYQRFTDYQAAQISGVATVYPEVFERMRRRRGEFDHHYADAVTADIASIRGSDVLATLQHVLQRP